LVGPVLKRKKRIELQPQLNFTKKKKTKKNLLDRDLDLHERRETERFQPNSQDARGEGFFFFQRRLGQLGGGKSEKAKGEHPSWDSGH